MGATCTKQSYYDAANSMNKNALKDNIQLALIREDSSSSIYSDWYCFSPEPPEEINDIRAVHNHQLNQFAYSLSSASSSEFTLSAHSSTASIETECHVISQMDFDMDNIHKIMNDDICCNINTNNKSLMNQEEINIKFAKNKSTKTIESLNNNFEVNSANPFALNPTNPNNRSNINIINKIDDKFQTKSKVQNNVDNKRIFGHSRNNNMLCSSSPSSSLYSKDINQINNQQLKYELNDELLDESSSYYETETEIETETESETEMCDESMSEINCDIQRTNHFKKRSSLFTIDTASDWNKKDIKQHQTSMINELKKLKIEQEMAEMKNVIIHYKSQQSGHNILM